MVKKIIDLKETLSGGTDPEYFANVLSYYNNKVDAIAYDPQKSQLAVTYRGSAEEIESILEEIKAKLGRQVINRENQVVYTRSSTAPLEGKDMWREMVRQGLVFDYGQGHVSYGGLFLELFETLNELLKGIAARFSAHPLYLPNFISTDYIKRLGLVDEFPHYLFFVSPLAKEVNTIENFQKEEFLDRGAVRNYLEPPGYCLKSAACSLLYPIIENKDFESTTYFTMLGTISRRESFNVKSFERLREFHQREIVFIGDEQGAKEFRQFALALFKTFMESLDLTASITTANDSFFVSNYNRFRLMQLLGHDKYEAQVLIPATKSKIAAASFNHHRNFFSKRFGFTFRGAEANTACIGFGLERLVYALISHHGLERSKLLEMLGNLKAALEPA